MAKSSELSGSLRIVRSPELPLRDTKDVMDHLRKLAVDDMAPITRIGAGAVEIGNWSGEVAAREGHAEMRRRLEALDNEIARMATTDSFWTTMRDAIRRNS
jgi:hypothetical protein